MIPSWMEDAKCADETAKARLNGPETARRVADSWFPPERLDGYAADRSRELDLYARTICAGCPVLTECLTYALAAPELMGVWGGTHQLQRIALTKKGRRAA